MNLFEEYLNNENLDKRERAKLWRTSIGLQAVDNLRVSNFLIETARKHIEGKTSMDEVSRLIDEHYKKKKL
ncbi:antitoxin VbhA family protein [Bacteroides fragilis]|uniref:antitoxin VbhA family protein n=1 Tax=Bacteroidales TaxID=171549 RepID=UPI00319D8FD1